MEEKELLNLLVDETFSQDRASDIKVYKGCFIARMQVYRVVLSGKTLDFPAGWAFFPKCPTSYKCTLSKSHESSLIMALAPILSNSLREVEFNFYRSGDFDLVVSFLSEIKSVA